MWHVSLDEQFPTLLKYRNTFIVKVKQSLKGNVLI
jgi:hypothetical protein